MQHGNARALEGLTSRLDEVEGTVSVYYGPLDSPPRFLRNAEETHYAASTMKVAVMAAAYRQHLAGALDLDTTVAVHDDFRSAADGSSFRNDPDYDNDPEPWAQLGSTATLRWLIRRMIVRSSNLATNLVLEQVGPRSVAEVLADSGAKHSVVMRGIEDYTAAQQGYSNLVTATDLANLLVSLRRGQLAGSRDDAEMVDVLLAQEQCEDVVRGLPPGTPIAHKNGWIEGIRHSAAVVMPDDAPEFVLVICTTAPLDEQQGKDLLAEVAGAAWFDRKR